MRFRAVAALLLVAACSGGGGEKASPATTTSAPAASTTTTAAGAATTIAGPAAGWTTTNVKVGGSIAAGADAVAVVDATKPQLAAVVIDAKTGKERFRKPWTVSSRFGGMGVGEPAVVAGVLVTQEAAGTKTALAGYDVTNGTEKWRTNVVGSFGPVACGPNVCADETDGGDAGTFVARSPATGASVWTKDGLFDVQADNPAGLLILKLGAPVLFLLDPATGAVKWQRDLSPVIGEGVDTGGGWQFDIVGSRVIGYVGSGAEEGSPGGGVGLDLATGAVQWKRSDFVPCPLAAGDAVLACPDAGGLGRIDPATGKDLWSFGTIDPPSDQGGPWIGLTADGTRATGTEKGVPVAIDLATGAKGALGAGDLVWIVSISGVKAQSGPSTESYTGSLDPVPSGPAVASAAQVPAGIGVTVAGFRVFIDGSGALRALAA